MLELQNIKFKYSANDCLMQFDFKIENRQKIAVIGSNGAGKSTLSNLIAGFLKPIEGKIIYNGEDITNMPPHIRPMTTLFQKNNLFYNLNVNQNIALSISGSLLVTKDLQKKIDNTLSAFSMLELKYLLPEKLSVGQQQKVALVKVLLRNKPVLIMDEPFAALDPFARSFSLDILNKVLQKRENFLMIMITHNYEDAKFLADKYLYIQNGKIKHYEQMKLISKLQSKYSF